MRKGFALLCMALCLIGCMPRTLAEGEDAPGAELEEGISAWLNKLDLAAWESVLSGFPGEVRAVFGTGGLSGWIGSLARSGAGEEGQRQAIQFKRLFSAMLKEGTGRLIFLLGIAFFSAIVSALSLDDKKGVAQSAAFIIRCMALAGVLSMFLSVATGCMERIQQSAGFVEAAFPVLLTLLTAIGGTASAGVLGPACAVLVGTVMSALKLIVLPLAILSGVLSLLDKLFEKSRLNELSKLSGSAAKWTMGAVSTLFIGSISLKSLAAATFDSVSIKSAKYAAGSLVPIVGSLVSGTMETMLGCAVLVKSSAGLAALLVVSVSVACEILRILSAALILRLAAAVSQPIAEARLVALYGAAADAMKVLLAVTIAAALAFLALIGIMTSIGNVGFAA